MTRSSRRSSCSRPPPRTPWTSCTGDGSGGGSRAGARTRHRCGRWLPWSPPNVPAPRRPAGNLRAVEDGLAAWSAVLRVQAQLAPEFDRRLQTAAGLPVAWYDVLLDLDAAEGRRLTMGELGER